MVELEKRGVPTAYVASEEFGQLAREELTALGLPQLPVVLEPHPPKRFTPEQVKVHAERNLPEIVHVLTTPAGKLDEEYRDKGYPQPKAAVRSRPAFAAEGVEVKGSAEIEAANRLFYGRGWTDGLPIVPPTRSEVARMLEYTDRDPREVVAVFKPRRGKATVEKIAINAVMAGCLPAYFPVVLAAVEAMSAPEFNLPGIIATTNPATPIVIINGPVVKELEVNYGYGLFGSVMRANATIGRAVRLVVLNIAGGEPGIYDRSTFGQAGKYSLCIAENEDENPWEPLHVELGYPEDVSTVTVFGGAAPHNIIDMMSTTGKGLLSTMVGNMVASGSNNIIAGGGQPLCIFGPEQAMVLKRDGFDKKSIRDYLFKYARAPYPPYIISERVKGHSLVKEHPIHKVASSPEEIMVLVAGGGGSHASFVASFFDSTRAVTRPIAFKDGTPVKSMNDFRRSRR
ncbi:MAG: hypothetical protein HYX92_09650 [Chloroflexi bacterium]|nr:hypothetical protein [Chloroflexota bacterium]